MLIRVRSILPKLPDRTGPDRKTAGSWTGPDRTGPDFRSAPSQGEIFICAMVNDHRTTQE